MEYKESDLFQGMEYVYAVYKEGSFSKAAKALYISQPSLSTSVKRVEVKLGYPIFERSTKALKLTDPGRRYIRAIEEIMLIQRNFNDYLNNLEELKGGSLILGGSSLYASWFIPPLMQKFAQRYPNIELRLVEESTPELIRLLKDEEIDILLDNLQLNEENFDKKRFAEERLYLAVPKSYEENEQLKQYQCDPKLFTNWEETDIIPDPVPICKFRQRPFILLKPENDTRIRGEKICRSAGFQPQILFEVDHQLTAYHITCAGTGISFVSDTLLSFANISDTVAYYALPETESNRMIQYFWKKTRYLSRAMEEFLKIK